MQVPPLPPDLPPLAPQNVVYATPRKGTGRKTPPTDPLQPPSSSSSTQEPSVDVRKVRGPPLHVECVWEQVSLQ